MLTKDLIVCRTSGHSIYPGFVALTHQDYLAIVNQMLGIFPGNEGKLNRSEIEECLAQMGQTSPNQKISQGIQKTIMNLCQFSANEELDYGAERRKVFLRAAAALRNADGTEADYHQAVQNMESPFFATHRPLYSDLPDNDLFIGMERVTPQQVLEQYNCGLVQGMLLYCRRLELELNDVNIAQLRRLLTAVRFHRLACELLEGRGNAAPDTGNAEKKYSVVLNIEGPESILSQARSYGFQLACFFPQVCALPRWRMRADVFWNGKSMRLDLDEHSRVSNRGRASGYEPEEIAAFKQHFEEKKTPWDIVEEVQLLKSGTGALIVPDFCFKDHFNGKLRYLELFHRWHGKALVQRLKDMEQGMYPELVVGVDKSILGDSEIQNMVENSAVFAARGFTFRDFPNVDKLCHFLGGLG